MIRLVLFALLLLTPAFCSAETFKWVDEKGGVGFADDLGKIPEKYRGKAVSAESPDQAVEVVEKAEPGKAPRNKDEAKQEQKPAVDDAEKEKAKPLFDGKDGASWKRDFARQKQEISSLEEQAARIKERMTNPGKMSRGEFLTLQSTSRDLDSRISVARKKLEALDAAANRAELPADFR